MWESPALRGSEAEWQIVGDVWTDNTTVLKDGFLSHEFVTIDFLGSMPVPSDSNASAVGKSEDDANTFYFLNNVGGNGGGDGCCSGTTSYTVLKQPHGPGSPFAEYGPGQQMVDWGSFTLKDRTAAAAAAPSIDADGIERDPLDLLTGTASRGLSMARTLGSEDADQVTKEGRRVLIGWTGPAPAQVYNGDNLGSAQSLPRDLFMDPHTSKLVQRFAPELKMLRKTPKPELLVCCGHAGSTEDVSTGITATELIVSFPAECAHAPPGPNDPMCGFEVLGNGHDWSAGRPSLKFTMDTTRNLLTLNGTTLGNPDVRAGPIPPPSSSNFAWTVHVIVDHSIVEIIVNGDTAFVVYVAPAEGTEGNVRVFGRDGARADIWRLNDAHNNTV